MIAIAGCFGGERDEAAQNMQESGENGSDTYDPSEIEEPDDIGDLSLSDEGIEDLKSQVDRVDYRELMRYAEDYVGEPLGYRDNIAQVQTLDDSDGDNGSFEFRMNVNADLDDILAYWQGTRILEDDWVDIWGVGGGRIEYETVLGSNREIPVVYVVDLEIVNDEVDA